MDFFRTEKGKTLRFRETEEGMLSVDVLRDGEWHKAPLGMIGLRLAAKTRRLTANQIKALPD